MCGNGMQPPYGIPIPAEIHEQYSPELKTAWETFDSWFKKAREESATGFVSKASMPADVKAAMELILSTPIPSYEDQNICGNQSCYMQGVSQFLID